MGKSLCGGEHFVTTHLELQDVRSATVNSHKQEKSATDESIMTTIRYGHDDVKNVWD